MVPFKPLFYRGEGESFQGDYIPFQQANESFQSKHWSEYDIIYIRQLSSGWCILLCQRWARLGFYQHTGKRKQTCQSNVWKKTLFGIKGLVLTADICLKDDITHQCLYMENIPFVFCKKCNEMSPWHTLERAIPKMLAQKCLSPKRDMKPKLHSE